MSDAPTSYLRAIAEAITEAESAPALPPVDRWQPAITRDIDMRIARNGDWYYQGSRIDRSRMVRLFASVLRRDEDGIFLVTPHERLRLRVDDAPFTAVIMEQHQIDGLGPVLTFTTNLGERVRADEAHRIRVVYAEADAEPAPYIDVRQGLPALISRSVFMQLAEHLEAQDGRLGVFSCGSFMPLDDPATDAFDDDSNASQR